MPKTKKAPKKIIAPRPIVRRRPSVPDASVAVPPQDVKDVPAAPRRKPEKDVRKDGKPTIWVDIERGNRMMVKWPDTDEGLTKALTFDEDNELNTFMGTIEDLTAQGAKKKLIPLNFHNAARIVVMLRTYKKLKDFRGNDQYNIEIDEAFEKWYWSEEEAKKLVEDAHHLLQYDEAAVQTVFPFLKKPLHPWQGPAFQFINAVTRHGRGVFLCDETGLGKTYTVTAHLVSMNYKAVVLCPAGLRQAWARKIKDISDLSVLVVGSHYPLDAYKYDVIIISYAMLKRHGTWPLSDIIDEQERVLILDEGHAVKNYDSNRTAISLQLSRFAKHSIVVTATPLKNRVGELHPLLRITRRLWTEMSYQAFIKCHSTPEGQEEIADHLKGFMVRRMAHEVWAEAPDAEIGEAWLTLSNRSDYDEAEQDFIQWLIRHGADVDRLEAAQRGHALVKLNKLRELSATGKVEAASEIIEQTMDGNEQVVVFCAFNEPLMKLAERFVDKTGQNYKGQTWRGSGLLVGSVSETKRNILIDSFMKGETGLLCVGTMAGGLGIDLPIASVGYFMDLPWTPADFEQCTGRLNRLGQERDCQFIKMLASGTIDQRMEEIIQLKAHTFRRAIGDEGIIARVTARDAASLRESIVSSLIRSYLRDAG